MDCLITALPQQYAMGIKTLKDLYGFRLLLKKKVAEYKKVVGQEPSHKKLGEILWSCMDVGSKQLASQSGLDKKAVSKDVDMYKVLCEDVDRRYRIQYGTLDFKTSGAKDDPMGLSSAAEMSGEEAEERAKEAAPDAADLDAVGKGRGKGTWMLHGGKCNRCSGENHIERYCPSKVDANGK